MVENIKPPSSKKLRLFSTFQFSSSHGEQSVGSKHEAEISVYLGEPTLKDLDSNPLPYWKDFSHRFPILSLGSSIFVG